MVFIWHLSSCNFDIKQYVNNLRNLAKWIAERSRIICLFKYDHKLECMQPLSQCFASRNPALTLYIISTHPAFIIMFFFQENLLAAAAEGWEYAPLFTMKFHHKERKMDLVRRRRWHRKMVAEQPGAPCFFQMKSSQVRGRSRTEDSLLYIPL